MFLRPCFFRKTKIQKLPFRNRSPANSQNQNWSSGFGASTGQTPEQVPQPMQSFGFITYLLSPFFMHETGHDAAQAPQLIHSSPIL